MYKSDLSRVSDKNEPCKQVKGNEGEGNEGKGKEMKGNEGKFNEMEEQKSMITYAS